MRNWTLYFGMAVAWGLWFGAVGQAGAASLDRKPLSLAGCVSHLAGALLI